MRLALAQLALGRNLRLNLERSLGLMGRAAEEGAEVICFPELQLSPFFPQFAGGDASEYAVTVDDDAIQALRERCAALDLIAFPNVYLREGEQCFDASLAIGRDGSLLGVSKMVHVVQAPGFFEQDYYTPSDNGFQVYGTPVGKLGVVICFDRHYPESFRACVLRGAQAILVPTANVRGEDLEMFEWEMRVSAMQNGVFVAMCNRVGTEDAMEFSGGSVVIGPDGDVLARAGEGEELLMTDVAFEALARSTARRSYLPLRRPGAYGLEERPVSGSSILAICDEALG